MLNKKSFFEIKISISADIPATYTLVGKTVRYFLVSPTFEELPSLFSRHFFLSSCSVRRGMQFDHFSPKLGSPVRNFALLTHVISLLFFHRSFV